MTLEITNSGEVVIGNRRFRLVSGEGDFNDGTACAMSAAVALWRFQNGEPLGQATDVLDCACPVLRGALIFANDALWWPSIQYPSFQRRTETLAPYIEKVLNTKVGKLVERMRVGIALDYAVQRFVPMALDYAGYHQESARLKGMDRKINFELRGSELIQLLHHIEISVGTWSGNSPSNEQRLGSFHAKAATKRCAEAIRQFKGDAWCLQGQTREERILYGMNRSVAALIQVLKSVNAVRLTDDEYRDCCKPARSVYMKMLDEMFAVKGGGCP